MFRSVLKVTHNGFGLYEGGELKHKTMNEERMLIIAVNVERSTAPPLLPNVCYAFVPYL
jgi:hypothetical protein